MKNLRNYIKEQLSDVKTKWHPKDGLFTEKDPKKIADYLLKHSKDKTQAMQRLCFYMNRAGDKLSNKTVLNKVKDMLKEDRSIDEKLVINKNTKLNKLVVNSFEELEKIITKRFYNGYPESRYLDLTDIDVSKLGKTDSKNRPNIFGKIRDGGCRVIDVTGWDVSEWQALDIIFAYTDCFKIVGLDTWDVSGITSMIGVFNNSKIEELDLSSWDISNVTSMYGMFTECKELKDLNINGWEDKLQNTCDLNFMFSRTSQKLIPKWLKDRIKNN